MKKKIFKGFTVLALLVCLVTALAACGPKDNGNDTGSNSKPKDPYDDVPVIVDATNQAKATNFFTEMSKAGSFENLDGDLFIHNGFTLEFSNPAAINTKTPFFKYEDMSNPTVYVDLDVQAVVNVNKTTKDASIKEIYTYVNARGSKEVSASDETVVYGNIYFKDVAGDDTALISLVQGSTEKFIKKFNVGNVNDIVKNTKALGTPSFDNFLEKLEGIINNISPMPIQNILGTSIESVLKEQISPLFTRMLFDRVNGELVPKFKFENNKYTFETNSNIVNDTIKEFFEKSAKVSEIANATKKDPTDSNIFFIKLKALLSGFETEIDIDSFKDIKIKNDTVKGAPVSLNMTFDKSANGLTNGEVNFIAHKGTYLELPAKTEPVTTKSSPFDIKVSLKNINITAEKLGTKTVNTSTFTNKAAVEALEAINIGKMNASGKLISSDANDKNKVTKTFNLNMDVNVLKFLQITGKAQQDVEVIDEAINTFNLTILNEDNSECYSVIYNKANKVFEVKINGEVNTNFNLTATDLKNTIKKLREVFTFKAGQSVFDKIDLSDLKISMEDGLILKKGDKVIEFPFNQTTTSTDGNTTVTTTGLVVPVGFDSLMLDFLNLDYTSLLGKDPQFVKNIFGNANVGYVEIQVSKFTWLE